VILPTNLAEISQVCVRLSGNLTYRPPLPIFSPAIQPVVQAD